MARQESSTTANPAYPGLRQDADLHFYNVSVFIEKPVNIATLEARVKELVG